MPQKATTKAKKETKKSVVILPSGVVSAEGIVGGEETEIAAQITVPSDGGWGWVVLACSFSILAILDGNAFTFGCLLPDISKELDISSSLVALVNSIETGLYFIVSPLSSALINRFGFRTIAMTGSVLCCFGLFASYFTTDLASLIVCYGCILGFGCSLVSMSASLIVGFYFEKLRSIAMAIVTIGSSVGIMLMYPTNTNLVKLAGWRTTVLFHSGLHGIIYFLSLSYRPLLSLTVTKTEERGEPTRTVTYLPSASVAHMRATVSGTRMMKPTTTQRVFGAVSTAYFPTAAAIIEEHPGDHQAEASSSTAPGPSAAAVSKVTLTAQGAASRRQVQQMKSMVSRSNFDDNTKGNVEITIHVEEKKKKSSCWGRLCDWESDAPQNRPIYRDDVFYDGKLENLPQYQKSVMAVPEEQRTGLEYQMAVSRAVTVNDMQERRGVFTMAVRRVLATMLDLNLLKRNSFLFFCFSGLLTYVGVLVPYVFLQDRNLQAGVDPEHCCYFVSVLSFSNAVGRLTLSSLSMKFNPLTLYTIGLIGAGVSTSLSTLSYSVVYQYMYSITFGFCIASISSLRSIVIVSLYGLESLTNASGVVIMFLGFGNLFSTPLAGALRNMFGYEVSFYVAGAFIATGGLVSIPIKFFATKELKKKEEEAARVKNRRGSLKRTASDDKKPPGEKRTSFSDD